MNVMSKEDYEQEALARILTEKHYFSRWRELSLWLAVKRLERRGVVREAKMVSNCFYLTKKPTSVSVAGLK